MTRAKAFFKGRVTEINGSRITIDTKAEPRDYKDPKTGDVQFLSSAFEEPQFPKIGAVVRGIFHKRDLR